jgi:glucokinase
VVCLNKSPETNYCRRVAKTTVESGDSRSSPTYSIEYHVNRVSTSAYPLFVLGADVGGTNTNLGVSGVRNNKPVLLFSLHFRSQELKSLTPAINETLRYAREKHGIRLGRACIGAAGPVSANHGYCRLINAEWSINAREVLKKTRLRSLFIINDFEAVGYGVNLLNPKIRGDVLTVRKEVSHGNSKTTRAVIGAGTGLGKNILVYDDRYKAHIPVPSEGGHADFPAQNEFELKLIEFIRGYRRLREPVNYEEVISGRGIEAVYEFLKSTGKYKPTRYTREIDESGDKTPLIAGYRNRDAACREAFRLYTTYYARCAKNFVLDTLASGGLYIAGGVAAKNPEIFKTKEFIKEFENAYKQTEILKTIPIYVILNHNIGLYGSCFAACLRKDLAVKG